MPDYFLDMSGETTGPFTLEEIGEMLNEGIVNEQTLCSTPGATQWIPVGLLEGLRFMYAPTVASKPPLIKARKKRLPAFLTVNREAWIVGSVLLSCLFVATLTHRSGTEANVSSGSMTKEQIYFEAKYCIRDKLKAPASADFSDLYPGSNAGASLIAPNTWEAFGWVDAINSFGAKLRSDWLLIMQMHNYDGQYTVLYYRIGDEEAGDLSAIKAMLDIQKSNANGYTWKKASESEKQNICHALTLASRRGNSSAFFYGALNAFYDTSDSKILAVTIADIAQISDAASQAADSDTPNNQ
ncbi:MAG TPA: DUF4339 domain-containing protein [Verrucomicrobiae bacterium]|nr:DUF4339 domain-containing protein [Verrucomicrobiae bacterium]